MGLLRRLQNLFRLSRVDSEIAEELEFHRAMKQRELQDAGFSEEQAARAASREMGSMSGAREDARRVWLPVFIDGVIQDCAYAMRNLRRQPGFAIVAIGTLAAAIGLNTSVFTVFAAGALRPWTVPQPSRVVSIYQLAGDVPQGSNNAIGFSVAETRFLNSHSQSFEGVVAERHSDVRFGSEPGRQRPNAMIVTGNYFRVLGLDMERGRGFMPDEDETRAPQAVAVLSYTVWQNRFAGDPEIVGRQIRLDDVPFTIVGVASRNFGGTSELRPDVWVPFASLRLLRSLDPSINDLLEKADNCCSAVFGRLRPGSSRDQARAELQILSRRFHHENSLKPGGILFTDTTLFSHPGRKGKVTAMFALMFAGVLLILLLACANVGNLLIARAAARRREIATRLSIGASRARIVRQMLTESLVLAFAASFLGIGIAYVLPPYVLSRATDGLLNLRIEPDMYLLAFSVLLSFATAVVFGLAPALHATRVSVVAAMKEQVLSPPLRLRSALLSVQVAASVVLLVSAALMMRGVQQASQRNPGFSVAGVSVISFDLPVNAYNPARTRSLLAAVQDGLTDLPNVRPYGLTRAEPFANAHWQTSVRIRGQDSGRDRLIEMQEIGGDYLGLLGIAVVGGRGFDSADAGRPVILVNETFAARYFPESRALGGTVVLGGKQAREIVGVVKDTYSISLDSIEPLIYAPLSGTYMPKLLVGPASSETINTATAIARRLDSRILVHAEPLTAQLERHLAPARIASTLGATLGMLALVLATVGTFGVFAYVVRQRTQEIGIRMALGARPTEILGLLLGACSPSLLTGFVLGMLISIATSRVIHSFLYGLSEFDALAYGSVCLVLLTAAVSATWIPARRAMRVEPVQALRYE